MSILFSDAFNVSPNKIERYGAFNVSLAIDLPLFVDPFLLFASKKKHYKNLHERMINYLRYLRDRSLSRNSSPAVIKQLYQFPEVKQNWLGFSATGNRGRGLGYDFANELNNNLKYLFTAIDAGNISRSSHLEKIRLVKPGVGRDMISDFTVNLIKDFLLSYTEAFAMKYIKPKYCGTISVLRVTFDHNIEIWLPGQYYLPIYRDDYVILTPREILTRDETWINRNDMYLNFRDVPTAIENEVLREQVNGYFIRLLSRDESRKGHTTPIL